MKKIVIAGATSAMAKYCADILQEMGAASFSVVETKKP